MSAIASDAPRDYRTAGHSAGCVSVSTAQGGDCDCPPEDAPRAFRAGDSTPAPSVVGLVDPFPLMPIGDELTALVAFRAAATRMKAADVELRAAQQEYASAIKQLSEAATK